MDAIFTNTEAIDIDISDEEYDERNIMEHLLFRVYPDEYDDLVYYFDEEWIELWEEYVRLQEENPTNWTLGDSGISGWDDVDDIVDNFKLLKKKAPEVFEKAFTGRFISQLLYEMRNLNIQHQGVFDPKCKKIFKWINKEFKGTVSDRDFWEVVLWKEKSLSRNGSVPENVVHQINQYAYLWKKCFNKPIYINMSVIEQRRLVVGVIEYSFNFDALSNPDSIVNKILSLYDGFLNMKKCYINELIPGLVKRENKEVLHLALRKNLLTAEMMKEAISYAKENNYLELMPLLILKQYGEWPTPERGTEMEIELEEDIDIW